MNTKPQKTTDGVIVFYSFKQDITGLSMKEVWEIVMKSPTKRSCRDVWHFSVSPKELHKEIDQAGDALFEDIENAYFDNCAEYMFISPTVGEPISGFHIKDWLELNAIA